MSNTTNTGEAYQLAQVNIARPLEPLDSPRLADFMDALDDVNAVADASEGFVWRLQSEDGNATNERIFDDQTLVNMSVWLSVSALENFVRGEEHMAVFRRRGEWFAKMLGEAYMALWWVDEGHIPTIGEAEKRLTHLRVSGPTQAAFNFRTAKRFPALAIDL